MEPQPEEQITLSNQAELADFLDINYSSWSSNRQNRTVEADLERATVPTELEKDVHLERVVLGFWFNGCTTMREWSATTNEGSEVGSPFHSQLKPAAFDYLVKRFEHTSNPYLKARYGLVLWNAPKPYKHVKYIHGAYDSLHEALTGADCSNVIKMRDCVAILRQMCAIATDVRYRQEDAVTDVLTLFNNSTPFERKGRNQLFTLITEYPKLFRPKASAILDTARNLFEETFDSEDFFACQHIARIAAPFAQSVGLDVQAWHYKTGRACEGLARSRMDDVSGLIPYKFYTDAAKSYQLAGDKEAERQALQKIQNLKGNIRLGKVSVPLPNDKAQQLVDDIRKQIEYILSFDSNSIFNYLATDERVIPDYAIAREQASKLGFSFADMIPSSTIDVNKNTQQQKSDGSNDVPTEKINRLYSINLSLQQQLLVTLFVEGCRSGKLTFQALSDYLDENSWIAQPMTETDFDGNVVQYTWQDLLYPAVKEIFKQLNIIVQEAPEATPSFVLCLDSLTLKIEGMLRELLQRAGDPTITTHKKGNLREVYFDDLVDMAKESGLLTENEAYFFCYVFTGLSRNIRNDVAHSYYHLPEYYSLASTILVFTAALRLIGFKLTPAPTNTEPE